MSSSQPTRIISKKEKGAIEGKLYEIILLLSLAGKVRELSKNDSRRFCKFTIGREIKIDKYTNIDDIVLSYEDQDKTKNLIFIQLKHMQDYKLIDSEVLSTVAARTKDIKNSHGSMCKDFNLQKYFISFLSVRNELKFTNAEELKDGKIKYVILFTNIGLERKELVEKGFSLKKAPGEIIDLFTLSSESQLLSAWGLFYQLGDVSEDLRKIFKKSSDLDRLALELAPYVVCEDYRQNRIMGLREASIKHYHVALDRQVIRKSLKKQTQHGQHFCEAQFREDFLDCDQTSTNLHPLRKALFEAIRELGESKKDANDDELKRLLKEAKWKIVFNFDRSIRTDFPCEWILVRDEDIKDFMECFVFILNQPRATELELLYKHAIQGALVEDTSMRQFVDNINAAGSEFRDCVEKLFGLDIKRHDDEKWISDNQIEAFMKEKQQLLRIMFIVSAMTLMHKNEIMQYGKFSDSDKINENIRNFLTSVYKILCVNTPVTVLTSIKISQRFNKEENCSISVSMNILNSTENRECVLKAFKLESISLLMIECREAFKNRDLNFLHELVNIAKTTSNKKIILIMQPENCDICMQRFKADFEDDGICVIENDSINLKYFEPKEDPVAKKVFVFQGQEEKVSLSDVTGISSWHSYVDNLCEGNREQGVLDGMTLVDILNNDEIKVGSKPAGMSSLEGAYAPTYEEVNVETLVYRLTSRDHGNDANDVYVISGVSGSSEQDKKHKLFQYLERDIENEELKNSLLEFKSSLNTVSANNLQIFDDQFQVIKFKKICDNNPEKRIFWICLKRENNARKFMLQEIYNPKFYLRRKFKNCTIKRDLKNHLMKEHLSEIYIFHCTENKQALYDYMQLNEREIEQIEDNRKIRIFFEKSDAESSFKELSSRNETVHFLSFDREQFLWCKSHGSVKILQEYIYHQRSKVQLFDYEQSERFLIEEDKFIEKMKDRNVMVFADDPGMGKSTTLIKLCETEIESSSIIKSHWVINIKLRDHLKTNLGHKFEKDGISILDVIEFLSTVDLSLNNNLAKILLKIVLDKSKLFQAKPLLLIFDGFDEVLDEVCRHRILMLLQFLKHETAAKIWITTRCHFKELLEEKLSTIAIQLNPMNDAENAQYIATYLKHRLYLILNKDKYIDLFYAEDKKKNNVKIHIYTVAFINKMKSIFKGDISTFIGTPLQPYLMLECTVKDFKIWIEEDNNQMSLLQNDIWDVYEYFINRKYDIYFLKKDIPERSLLDREKNSINQDHKDFAVSKILKMNAKNDIEQFKDVFLLVGLIKFQGNNMEFIHKTFQEFFASKAFVDWIKKPIETDNQERLLTVILLKPDYQLIRIFINIQLQKLSEQSKEGEGQDELDESLKHYGNTLAKLFSEKNSPLIDVNGTPLHIAAEENNKNIVWFLLKSLKGHPDTLKKFLFTAGEYKGTALHQACCRDDVEIVKALLDAAEGISEDTLQEFLKCSNNHRENALLMVAIGGHNVQLFKELWRRANNKLDLILTERYSALCEACFDKNEELVDFLLQEFQHEKHSLKKMLLYNGLLGNALCYARSVNTFEKLIAAAKSIEDNNETLKNMLLSEKGEPPLNRAVSENNKDKFEKLLNVAREIDDDNHTLIQVLVNVRHKTTPLHVAAKRGRGDFIKLLLETACDLGIEILEKLITAIDEDGQNAIDLMLMKRKFLDFFRMLEGYKYKNIRKKVMEMFSNVPLKRRFKLTKKKLHYEIQWGDFKEIVDILINATNSNANYNEGLSNLPSEEIQKWIRIWALCPRVMSLIIEELLFNAINMDDGSETLKERLTNIYRNCCIRGLQFKIKEIVERFIVDAEINNQAVRIMLEIIDQFTEGQLPGIIKIYK